MNKINWVRMLVGGLVAAIILFVTDGLFHENVVAADWKLVSYRSRRSLLRRVRSWPGSDLNLPLRVDESVLRARTKDGGLGGCRGLDCLLTYWPGSVHSAGILFKRAVVEGRSVPVGYIDCRRYRRRRPLP
jgi:hypothetical protein